MRNAREGKVIAGQAAIYGRTAFGFKYNEKRDVLVLGEEQIRQLEEDKEALDAPERNRVYKMLRVEATVAPDGSLEVSEDIMSDREMETL